MASNARCAERSRCATTRAQSCDRVKMKTTYAPAQIDLVQQAYEKKHGKSLRAAIEKIASGELGATPPPPPPPPPLAWAWG